MAEDRPGFLGRWARRKTDVLQGKPLDEPAAAPVKSITPAPLPVHAAAATPAKTDLGPTPETQTPAPEKLLSLDDVKLLTQESDFSPFMARSVGPDVRNAAMKKLFTDPHYNVMDGLDIYIGDYSIADPIPESMLRQMVGAKLLKIFDDDEDEDKDQVLERPALAADAALEPASDSGTAGAVDDSRAVSASPPIAACRHPVPPMLGVVPAPALSAPQPLAEPEKNSHADTAVSTLNRSHTALQPE